MKASKYRVRISPQPREMNWVARVEALVEGQWLTIESFVDDDRGKVKAFALTAARKAGREDRRRAELEAAEEEVIDL